MVYAGAHADEDWYILLFQQYSTKCKLTMCHESDEDYKMMCKDYNSQRYPSQDSQTLRYQSSRCFASRSAEAQTTSLRKCVTILSVTLGQNILELSREDLKRPIVPRSLTTTGTHLALQFLSCLARSAARGWYLRCSSISLSFRQLSYAAATSKIVMVLFLYLRMRMSGRLSAMGLIVGQSWSTAISVSPTGPKLPATALPYRFLYSGGSGIPSAKKISLASTYNRRSCLHFICVHSWNRQ